MIPTSAFCDDALLQVYGGGLKLQDGESTNIKMEAETVKIILGKNDYTVDATFEFFNYGKTTIAQVGFPKSGYGYAPGFKGVANFNSFETWGNGRKTNVKEILGEVRFNHKKADKEKIDEIKKGHLSGWFEETRWLTKSVTFVANAKTITRVRYEASYDGRRDEKYGEYLYGTGRSWKETIGKANFIIKASPGVTLLWAKFTENGYYQNIRKYEFRRLGEYEYEYVLRDIEPKENENLKFLTSTTWEAWDGPDYSVKRVERERLELLSLWQLRILRNSIYAFHGKIFTDPKLDNYFRKYDWYKPRPDFKESDLNKIEKENIAAIAAYENELKAASHK